MNTDFVQEIIEEEGRQRSIGWLTGWEEVVFEVEDDPDVGTALQPAGAG